MKIHKCEELIENAYVLLETLNLHTKFYIFPDIEMLKDLSLGKPPDNRIAELCMKHTNTLKHALKCEFEIPYLLTFIQ